MRTRHSAWNLVSGYAVTALTLLLGLAATPLLVRWLGPERYGAFRVASDYGGYLTLLELGLGGALQAALSRALGQRRDDEALGLLGAGLRGYVRVALVMAAAGAGLAVVAPVLIPVAPDVAADLRRGCWVAVLGCVLVPLAPLRALAEASQRGYVVHAALLLQSLTITGLSVALACAGWGITGQFLALIAGSLLFHGTLLADARRRHPGLLRASATAPEAGSSAELRRLSGPTLVFNLCGRLSLLTDNIIIARLVATGAVTPFVLTQRLPALLGGQVAALGNATWAALAELYHRGERDRFNARLIELTGLTSGLGLALLVPAAALNRLFVSLWVGGANYAGDAVTALAAANAWLLGFPSLWGWAFTATGRVGVLLPCLLVGTAVNLGVSITATAWLGPPGPLVGTAVQLVGVNLVWVPWLLRRHFGTPLRTLVAAAARPLLPAVVLLPLTAGLAAAAEPAGWPGFLAAAAASGAASLAAFWRFGLSRDERLAWRSRIAAAVQARRAA